MRKKNASSMRWRLYSAIAVVDILLAFCMHKPEMRFRNPDVFIKMYVYFNVHYILQYINIPYNLNTLWYDCIYIAMEICLWQDVAVSLIYIP